MQKDEIDVEQKRITVFFSNCADNKSELQPISEEQESQISR